MNINIGEETVNQFFTAGLVRSAADLYTVKASDVLRLERWARKSFDNFKESLEESTKVPYERVLFALGIPEVGEITAKRLANAFIDIDKLIKATNDQLIAVEDVGTTIARSVIDFFKTESNLKLIYKLEEFHLQFELNQTALTNRTDTLGGKIFVLTGTLPTLTRDKARQLIEYAGGRVSGSVSSKTNYVVAGAEAGAKLKEAQRLGIKIISENEFLSLLQKNNTDLE
jgi:DNA ligase (NAD+)